MVPSFCYKETVATIRFPISVSERSQSSCFPRCLFNVETGIFQEYEQNTNAKMLLQATVLFWFHRGRHFLSTCSRGHSGQWYFLITRVGTSYILENAKIRKRAGFWRDRNLCHVRQSHCPRKFFSTLENLLSRDIVSICYYSHILMKSAVLREFKIWSGAFPFFRCPPDWKPKFTCQRVKPLTV